ncbi:MAG: prolipoprotein diacylglyceryl transferase, partial [Acidobacteriota bacterium]|nr:prolipoprotein diacylglyceryl transferase [Acidobacteriota bacterium]
LNPRKIWNLGIYGILVALAVSKLWLVFSNFEYYFAYPRALFSLATLESGGVFYGGVIGGVAWVLLYAHFQKMPFLSVLDVSAAGVALGHGIGRLGCFAAGCCYGKPTPLPWGVTFTSSAAARLSGTPLHVALHPTQLYESGAEFLNFLILIWLSARQRFSGQLIGAYFILYGIERGTIELFRGDPGRTLLFHDSISLMQIVSAGLVLTGAFLWWRGLRRKILVQPAASGPVSSPSPS